MSSDGDPRGAQGYPIQYPSLEVEQRAAFSSLFDPHDTEVYHRVIDSIESDPMMNYLRTTVCLTIARVIPDDDGDRIIKPISSRRCDTFLTAAKPFLFGALIMPIILA